MDDEVLELTMKTGNNWGVGILIRSKDNLNLLAKRTDTKNWCTPGGKVEVGETPIEGLVREVKEEIGVSLDLNKVKYMGYHVGKFGNDKVWVSFLFYAEMSRDTEITLQESELSEYEWLSTEQCLSKELFKPTEILFDRYLKRTGVR